jgi:hypothetical protein
MRASERRSCATRSTDAGDPVTDPQGVQATYSRLSLALGLLSAAVPVALVAVFTLLVRGGYAAAVSGLAPVALVLTAISMLLAVAGVGSALVAWRRGLQRSRWLPGLAISVAVFIVSLWVVVISV